MILWLFSKIQGFLIFASRVSDLITIINPLVDIHCSQWLQNLPWDSWVSNQISLSKQHENNMTGVSQLYFIQSTVNYCLNSIKLSNILGICTQTLFFQQRYPWEKDNNSYQRINNNDPWTKSAKVKRRGSLSEAWLAKMKLPKIEKPC